jgi:hypothetical protein
MKECKDRIEIPSFFFFTKAAQTMKLLPGYMKNFPLCIICVHDGKSGDKCFLSPLCLTDACSGSHFIASSKQMRWQFQKDLA